MLSISVFKPYLRLMKHYFSTAYRGHAEIQSAAVAFGKYLEGLFPTRKRKAIRKPEDALLVAAALYLAQEHEPGLFKSDRNFSYVLANRIARSAFSFPANFKLNSTALSSLAKAIVENVGITALGIAVAVKKANTTPEGMLRGVNLPIQFPKIKRYRRTT